jgi:hypothetical protein
MPSQDDRIVRLKKCRRKWSLPVVTYYPNVYMEVRRCARRKCYIIYIVKYLNYMIEFILSLEQ